MSGNAHVRCEAGENPEMISKDYLSLFPKIDSAEMMFSASRSRRLQIVPIIQSFSQLEKNYGKEGAEIIDELKSMPKGQFIVMKTGTNPMKVKLKLFFKWGIAFGEPYQVPDQGSRPVRYASRQALMEAIHEAFPRLRPRSRPAAIPQEQPAKVITERKDADNG